MIEVSPRTDHVATPEAITLQPPETSTPLVQVETRPEPGNESEPIKRD